MESQAGITSERHTVHLFNEDEALSFPSLCFNFLQRRQSFPKTSCFLLYSLLFWDSSVFVTYLFLLWVVLWMCLPSYWSDGRCDKTFVLLVLYCLPIFLGFVDSTGRVRYWSGWIKVVNATLNENSACGSTGVCPLCRTGSQRSWWNKCTQER